MSDQHKHADSMPQYSIQQDPIRSTIRGSLAPSASLYSEDCYESHLHEPDMPQVAPLRLHKLQKSQLERGRFMGSIGESSYHAHADQHINDHGPQVRQSRLPIFNQVRSILHKPPPLATNGVINPDGPREVRSDAKKPQMAKRPSRKSLRGAFEVRRHSPRRDTKHSPDISPVSVLEDDEWEQTIPPGSDWNNSIHEPSPVSAISAVPTWVNEERHSGPMQVSVNAVSNSETRDFAEASPSARFIKRKPAPRSISLSENIPPQQPPPVHSPPPSRGTDVGSISEIEFRNQKSHMSWTTYGTGTPMRPSFDVQSRPSVDRPSIDAPRYMRRDSQDNEQPPVSRFSWSTVNTNMPGQMRPDSPPPSPPPPVPQKYKPPPVQSILSRHRPIQRLERQEWTPQPRKSSAPDSSTPTSARSKLSLATDHARSVSAETATPNSAKKQLPLPPDMVSPITPLSHLESLLREEQDKLHQRRNIEHAIVDLEKIQKASPMQVSFAQVRDANNKLQELRATLEEIKLEEREIGIKVARARRKEGDEETGLWIRRVAG
ncbi:hypothetical protein HII31_06697 [Pseudocercospora fuligena]|uniref:Uncharacterized protein n=1 Tax=Pseudocercospora fuligena TaxID=685502 RepID=A0A8H6RK54_9PEZI|nr:hypothetical protein HII31_06697 [Pseudocercospora fuligena]